MSRNKYFQDPTVPDKDNRKKAHYWTDKDKHINFLSKLRLDGLNQSQFHRAMIESRFSLSSEDIESIFDIIEEGGGL